MKIYLKKSIILTLILSLVIPTHSTEATPATDQSTGADATAQADAKPAAPQEKCNIKLVEDLGLKGQENATEVELAMCPTVKKSCCLVEDQLTMFDLWVTGKGKAHLENRFKNQTNVSFWGS